VPRFLVDMVDETLNRDELRTPMQWDTTNAAGFSKTEKTWLPVHTNFRQVNVEKEEHDPNSLLHMVQKLLFIRKTNRAISSGSLALLSSKLLPKGVLGYKRTEGENEIIVLINFTKRKKEFSLPGTCNSILAVNKTDTYNDGKICLDAFGGIVLKTCPLYK